jgi:hypothetical protein
MMEIRAKDGLFDIVIRGRGTWAAARRHVQSASFGLNESSHPNARVLQAKYKHETDRVVGSPWADRAINSVM